MEGDRSPTAAGLDADSCRLPRFVVCLHLANCQIDEGNPIACPSRRPIQSSTRSTPTPDAGRLDLLVAEALDLSRNQAGYADRRRPRSGGRAPGKAHTRPGTGEQITVKITRTEGWQRRRRRRFWSSRRSRDTGHSAIGRAAPNRLPVQRETGYQRLGVATNRSRESMLISPLCDGDARVSPIMLTVSYY